MDIKRFLHKEIPAPLWKRIVAYLIDGVILSLVLLPLGPLDKSYTSISAFFSQLTSLSFFTFQFILAVFFILMLSLAYWSILEYRFHQTLGKYFMKIIIRSQEKTLTFTQCLLRNVAKLSSLLLFADTLYMFFSHQSQRYSETLARTEVVQHV